MTVPFIIAKIGVAILGKAKFSPLNSEQLKLFENDNISSNNYEKLLDLDIDSKDIKEVIKNTLKKTLDFLQNI